MGNIGNKGKHFSRSKLNSNDRVDTTLKICLKEFTKLYCKNLPYIILSNICNCLSIKDVIIDR